MEHFIYAALILLLIGIALFLWVNEHRTAEQVKQELDEVQVEERRMFEFLHGLGESLQQDSSRGNLHRYIVEGVTKVVGADAGILYVFDEPNKKLVPVCQTKIPAPVLPLPPELNQIEDDKEALQQLRGYVRLSPLLLGESFIGSCLERQSEVFAEEITSHRLFSGESNRFQDKVSLIACPLIYGSIRVGVLAVTRKGKHFSPNDREVFASISEQSSFALGSAMIHREADEKNQLERELQQASEIQRVLLPSKPPQLSDYDVAACYRAARLVSGDYYDYVEIDKNHFGVAIGDVSGKGIAASLIAAMCRSLLRSNIAGNHSPSVVLHAVNQSIFTDIKKDMFVSLLYLILERDSDRIAMARAGHEPPILYRAKSNEIEIIEPPGMAAGIDEGEVFTRSVRDYRIQMEPDDVLILYTDGLIEATNTEGDEFGLDRFIDEVKEASQNPVEEIVDSLENAVYRFSGGAARSDDITLIAVKKR